MCCYTLINKDDIINYFTSQSDCFKLITWQHRLCYVFLMWALQVEPIKVSITYLNLYWLHPCATLKHIGHCNEYDNIFQILFPIFRFIHTIYYSPVQLEFTIILLAAVQVSIDLYLLLYLYVLHVCTCTYMTEFLICFETWVKLAQQWLACVPLGINIEPINKQLMLLVL